MVETLRHALCALILTLTLAAGSAYAHSPLTSSNPLTGPWWLARRRPSR